MLIPCVLSPNIFNFNDLNEGEKDNKYYLLKFLLKKILTRGIVLFDDTKFITSEIKAFIDCIDDTDIKKGLKVLLSSIFKSSMKEISVEPISIDEKNQYCKYFISAVTSNVDIYGFFDKDDCCTETCEHCLEKLVHLGQFKHLNFVKTDEFDNIFDKKSISSVGGCSIEMIKNEIFKNFIKYANELTIYDKQLTPDIQEQNIGAKKFDIPQNYKQNLEYWINYFYELNPSLNIIIYVSIKLNQHNIKRTIQDEFIKFKNKMEGNCADIKISFKYIEEQKSSRAPIVNLLHQRYFATNNIMLACDRGIDLINKQDIRDFNISVVEKNDEVNLRNYFRANSK